MKLVSVQYQITHSAPSMKLNNVSTDIWYYFDLENLFLIRHFTRKCAYEQYNQ